MVRAAIVDVFSFDVYNDDLNIVDVHSFCV